jgi:uncharacterized membrane protein
MKNKTTIITTLLCMLPLVISVIVYDKLPDQIAVHFDSAGNPDNYFPKAVAAFGLPIFFVAINLYTHFRVNKDPKVQNASNAIRILSRWAVPVISVVIVPVTLFMSMGAVIPISMIVTALVGIIIVLCGNYLPKCKRNYTVGIKLPWTLDNEDNWFKTHRFAGFVWVMGGAVITANAFLGIPYLSIFVPVVLVAGPFMYSYLYYRKQLRAEAR